MSDWPSDLKAGPIRAWPGELTRTRAPSQFKAPLSDTLKVLEREIYHLTTTRSQRESAEMLIAIPAGSDSWRIDGRPRANATPEHPGVILALDSRFGHLSYPCDTFSTWQSNLRAIAFALEALRKVDRYGVTKRGEQYRGFLAIEAARPTGFDSAEDALMFLAGVTGMRYADHPKLDLVRAAQRMTHPDRGGDPEKFQRVSEAEATLRKAGMIR